MLKSNEWRLSRRRALSILSACVGIASAPKIGWALGQRSQFGIAEIQLPSSLNRTLAWQRGLFEVQGSTSIEITETVPTVSLDSVDLFNHPFTALIGDDGFEPVSTLSIENLRRYLTYGGFLLLDDASGRNESGFLESCKRLCKRVFPNLPLAALHGDHSVYRSFFLLEKPTGRFQLSAQLLGVQVNTITPLMYNANDLSGALLVDDSGQYQYLPVPDGEYQRRESVKLLINLVLYALTSNYKHDQVHVAELLRRGEF